MHFIGCHTDLVMGVWGHITSQNSPKSPLIHSAQGCSFWPCSCEAVTGWIQGYSLRWKCNDTYVWMNFWKAFWEEHLHVFETVHLKVSDRMSQQCLSRRRAHIKSKEFWAQSQTLWVTFSKLMNKMKTPQGHFLIQQRLSGVVALFSACSSVVTFGSDLIPVCFPEQETHSHYSGLRVVNAQGGWQLVWFIIKQGKGREVLLDNKTAMEAER